MDKIYRVAIDGPAGAGKSTMAKILAEKLGIDYVDTGAMYRAIALKILKTGIDYTNEQDLNKLLSSTDVDYYGGKVYLDGEDVSGQIRTNEISMAASTISKLGPVRAKVDEVSKRLAATKDVVMEGRDIGTAVIPDAEVKIFMTAAPEIRAKRRYEQLVAAGKPANLEEIKEDIEKRDYQDSHREINPLKQADDAVYMDTSDMSIDENIDAVCAVIADKTGRDV